MKFNLLFGIAFVLVTVSVVYGFYIPGVAPELYAKDAKIPLKVSKLTSTKTQLPYEYYTIPVCEPKEIVDSNENLGEILSGDRYHNSVYEIEMGKTVTCKIICERELDSDSRKVLVDRINDEYHGHWILDNLPAAYVHTMDDPNTGEQFKIYEDGFPIGFVGKGENNEEEGVAYVNNHIDIKILYHQEGSDDEGSKIVGFEVVPYSLVHEYVDPQTCMPLTKQVEVPVKDDTVSIKYSYSVTWEKSEIKWVSRWDNYLKMVDADIHWFSIINSLLIVLFLSAMVVMIMLRTVHRDLAKYSEMENSEELQEETGWKLVHGDVFRVPQRPMLLSIIVGSGVQVFAMACLTMIFAVFGFLSPAHRGSMIVVLLVSFILMGYFAGYFSSRTFKMLKGVSWKTCTIYTAIAFPGIVFLIFFILNFFILATGSSAAVPFGTLVVLLLLWFGISIPLVFFGSYMGFAKKDPDAPTRTNQIPRQIPEQVWYMRLPWSGLIGGILPFGAVFIELYFIMSSIWLNQIYYVFGFLFLVLLILIITCGLLAIVMCYFQLVGEDYQWWWKAIIIPGFSAVHVFLFSFFYFFIRLTITGFVSGLLYFCYTIIICMAVFLMTGTIGHFSCLWFIRKIYGALKSD